MGHYGFCHRRHAVLILFLKNKTNRSSLQYFITQGMEFYVPYFSHYNICNLGGGLGLWVWWEEGEKESQGSIPAYCEACLRGQ